MSKLISLTRFTALSIGIAAATLLIVRAWIIREPWLYYLWSNVSHVLHQEWFVVPVAALIYIAAFLFARWHLIAWPIRLELISHISAIRLEVEREPPGDSERDRRKVGLIAMLDRAAARVNDSKTLDRILWTRGQEEASWREADWVACEVAFIQSTETVKARLMTAEKDLRAMSSKERALADLIHQELALHSTESDRIRLFLYEALDILYAVDDQEFADMLNWHNKVVWLTCAGILLLVLLEGVKRGGGGLFVAGVTGGFLGRLMRTLKQRDISCDDYDAYWTTMFVSPLVGALAGWTGILLIGLGVKLNFLGSTLSAVSLETGYGTFALGAAFLLGFSERFFDKILKPLDASGTSEVNDPASSGAPVLSTEHLRKDSTALTQQLECRNSVNKSSEAASDLDRN